MSLAPSPEESPRVSLRSGNSLRRWAAAGLPVLLERQGCARGEACRRIRAHSIAAAAPGASLDAVFAGATVSPSDARAASRLAGAFSGATGSRRGRPRRRRCRRPACNPRIPQAQESEEDVAKFRAWLDGLTRE